MYVRKCFLIVWKPTRKGKKFAIWNKYEDHATEKQERTRGTYRTMLNYCQKNLMNLRSTLKKMKQL